MEFVDRIIAVKKPPVNLVNDLLFSYALVGRDFGYEQLKGQCMLLLHKKEGTAAFEIQFGNRAEFLGSMRKLLDNKADICFFITSSRAHTMRLEDARYLLLKNFNIGRQKFVFIDVETNRALKVNFEWDKFASEMGKPNQQQGSIARPPIFRPAAAPKKGRHKQIFGKRGEHKEQD
ncbi:hypothetical protein J4441_03695 [Candidatus Micrarchaeota archaeon]|nr:hypothetical protein [Candidatus Micrarchaeota archaeon]